MKGEPLAGWMAYHLHYHEDFVRAINGFVRPAIGACHKHGLISRFFFIRYGFGGPHIRLRLEPFLGKSAAVDAVVRQIAANFLANSPSRKSLSHEDISRINASLLANDPQEEGEIILPDNLLLQESFVPEIGRYGGLDKLAVSLGYFHLSSAFAFRFHDNTAQLPLSQQLPISMLDLLRPALGFASSTEELLELVFYAAVWAKESGARFAERSKEAYRRSADVFRQQVKRRLENWLAGKEGWGPPLAAGARYVAHETHDLKLSRRRALATAQIHMTANRIGLSNSEEIYLGQILKCSLEDLFDQDRHLEARVAQLLSSTELPPPLLPMLEAAFSFVPLARIDS